MFFVLSAAIDFVNKVVYNIFRLLSSLLATLTSKKLRNQMGKLLRGAEQTVNQK